MAKSEDYRRAEKMCIQEGFTLEKVGNLSNVLLTGYRDGKWERQYNPRMEDIFVDETTDKQNIRRRFLDVMILPIEKSKQQQVYLIESVIARPWFDSKINLVLDELADFRTNGEDYRAILEACYIHPDKKRDYEIMDELGLSKSVFYEKRRVATVIFGILLWKYAKRREYEDMAKGLVPAHEICAGDCSDNKVV